MAKKVRHIHAGPNEWVRVHRANPRGDGENTGCALLIFFGLVILFFRGC